MSDNKVFSLDIANNTVSIAPKDASWGATAPYDFSSGKPFVAEARYGLDTGKLALYIDDVLVVSAQHRIIGDQVSDLTSTTVTSENLTRVKITNPLVTCYAADPDEIPAASAPLFSDMFELTYGEEGASSEVIDGRLGEEGIWSTSAPESLASIDPGGQRLKLYWITETGGAPLLLDANFDRTATDGKALRLRLFLARVRENAGLWPTVYHPVLGFRFLSESGDDLGLIFEIDPAQEVIRFGSVGGEVQTIGFYFFSGSELRETPFEIVVDEQRAVLWFGDTRLSEPQLMVGTGVTLREVSRLQLSAVGGGEIEITNICVDEVDLPHPEDRLAVAWYGSKSDYQVRNMARRGSVAYSRSDIQDGAIDTRRAFRYVGAPGAGGVGELTWTAYWSSADGGEPTQVPVAGDAPDPYSLLLREDWNTTDPQPLCEMLDLSFIVQVDPGTGQRTVQYGYLSVSVSVDGFQLPDSLWLSVRAAPARGALFTWGWITAL